MCSALVLLLCLPAVLPGEFTVCWPGVNEDEAKLCFVVYTQLLDIDATRHLLFSCISQSSPSS